VNETWYTGFAEANEQLRANHPLLALDNHIYIANGLRGGTIVDARHANAKPVSISGRDFRFDPHSHTFEAVSGVGQFGLTFDDFGNRFVCTNRNPVIHVVLEDRWLKKNPLVAVASVANDVAKSGAESRLFPIGRAWTTSNLHANQFTAACGVHIYRGNSLPGEYYGNAFTCEPTGHLIHREIMKPSGVTFVSTPARESAEFFASRDEWCSPVNLETGPDGALYVVDMYRQIIEHPQWMPEELRQRPNLRAGNDRGRIYRVVPKEFRRPAPRRLGTMTSAELVDLLASPNSWQRETAARLLLERQDKSVAPKLTELIDGKHSNLAAIHALWLLDSLGQLPDSLITQAMMINDPRVIEQAILVAGPRLAQQSRLSWQVSDMVPHPDPRVRFVASLSTNRPHVPPRLPTDQWELDAVLLAAGKESGSILDRTLGAVLKHPDDAAEARRYVVGLARLAAASPDKKQTTIAVESLVANRDYEWLGLAALFSEAANRKISVAELRKPLSTKVNQKLDRAFADAKGVAADADLKPAERGEAIDFLGFADDAAEQLLPIALNDADQSLRTRAIVALANCPDLEPWRQILASFGAVTPVMQATILDSVLSDNERTMLLLDAIQAGRIKPTVIDPVRAKRLFMHKDVTIRDRAAKLLAAAVPADRQKVLDDYRPALELKTDATRGRTTFEKRCAMCHQVGGIGVQLAPDISDSRERTPLQLLTDILQPNRAIDSNYFSFSVTTTDGRVRSGILSAETSTSVTLRQQEGKTETLRRDEIEELRSDGVSFMPEGLEKEIPLQDMADLIAFIKNWRYLESPQELTPAGRP
jgi:putative membrane-bound dehydrogenase-like protein